MAAIDMLSAFRYTFLCQREERGGIAQLGERLHGMQEVRGSIPLVSTILTLTDAREILHPFLYKENHAIVAWLEMRSVKSTRTVISTKQL